MSHLFLGPQLAQQAQDQYKDEGYVSVVPDAYTDSHPEENEYPDLTVRAALTRHVAFYYNGNDQRSALDAINSLLQQVAENVAITDIKQLFNILSPLKIRSIIFESLKQWQVSQEAVATAL